MHHTITWPGGHGEAELYVRSTSKPICSDQSLIKLMKIPSDRLARGSHSNNTRKCVCTTLLNSMSNATVSTRRYRALHKGISQMMPCIMQPPLRQKLCLHSVPSPTSLSSQRHSSSAKSCVHRETACSWSASQSTNTKEPHLKHGITWDRDV